MICINARFLTRTITGIERYATEISYALKKIDSDILLLCPANLSNPQLEKELIPKRIGIFRDHLWEQISLPLYLIKNKKPFLINLTNTAPIFYKNQVLVIHDLAFLHQPNWYTRKAAISFRLFVSKSANASKAIITMSNFTKQEIIKYLNVPAEKITVIPSAIPSFVKKYYNNEYENKYGEYILTVSSIEPRKNITNLVEAFIKLDRPNLKLLIVGKIHPRVFRKVRLDFTKNKNILMLGYVSDQELVGLYKNAKLFAYLSYYEGFGFPPIEAIFCGCTTIVSNTSSLPEVCGEFANYCDAYSTNDIVSKFDKILTDDVKIEEERLELFRQKFSWNNSARMMLDLINKVS
ncbi:MAG: glycosyltransferase family 1 protein [Ignavibacteriales bacterium]|nr:glycosyltransferase family 1 protein [Ignavibacteriales bacterium]